MKIAGFEFAEGARFQPGAEKNAKAVGEHIELLRKKCHGELTPEDVLADAKNNNSPLHSFFEWDNGLAAEQHRLQQARGLIRSVVAVYTQPDKPAIRRRAYVHVPEGQTSHYRETSHALSQKDTREAVMKQALSELQAWKRKYRDLKEFAALIDIIDRIDERSLKPVA